MEKETLVQLNSIYKPLWEKSGEICQNLLERGYAVTSGFYNNHSIKIDGSYVTEYFPIPVVTVKGVGDADYISSIGIDVDSIWFEVVLSKENMLSQNFETLVQEHNIEIYGVENYLDDIYCAGGNPSEIAVNIANSNETHFCITFYLEQNVNFDDILNIMSWGRVP